MVVKSHGPRRGTRKKFKKTKRTTVNELLKKFSKGDRVMIHINPSSTKGMPFRRFHGLSGTVKGRRGMAYLVEIKDLEKNKTIIVNPDHLKKI